MTKELKGGIPMLNYRTAQTADLPAMMKMVEEAKEGFRARNIDQWQKGEPNEQGLQKALKKALYMSWKKMEKF